MNYPVRKQGAAQLKIADTSGQDIVLEPRGSGRKWLVAAAVVAAVALLGWWVAPKVQRWAGSSVSVPLERLRLATVSRGDFVRDVSVQGRVVAAVSPTLFAPAPGTITLAVEAGAEVAQGQVLARIESPELENRLRQERASLEQFKVELDRQRIEARQKTLDNRKNVDLAQVTLTAAEREKRRADQAHAISAISKIDFEKAQDDLLNARLAHEHAVADAKLDEERLNFELKTRALQIERQELTVGDLERQVAELEMRSPVNGIVGNLLIDQKAAVARNQPVMAVVDLTQFEIEAQVPESYADDLGLGMAAEVSSGGTNYPATLVAVSPEIIANQVTTRLRFEDRMPAGLRQNQRLSARILLEEKSGVLTLPRGQFLETGGGRVGYVLGADRVARRRAIEIGARSVSTVEVLSGLDEGETVVISSIDQFQSADSVLVTD